MLRGIASKAGVNCCEIHSTPCCRLHSRHAREGKKIFERVICS